MGSGLSVKDESVETGEDWLEYCELGENGDGVSGVGVEAGAC